MLLPMRHRALRGLPLGIGIGTLAFGVSRDACQHLIRFATDRNWVEYATAIGDDGAVLFGTLLIDGTFTVGPPTIADAGAGSEPARAAVADPWFIADGGTGQGPLGQ